MSIEVLRKIRDYSNNQVSIDVILDIFKSSDNIQEILQLLPTLSEDNHILLNMRKLLWNEITVDEFDDIDQFVIITPILYHHNIIDIADLKNLLIIYFNHSLVEDHYFVFIADIIIQGQDKFGFDDWISKIKDVLLDLSSINISLTSVIDYYQHIYGIEVEEKWSIVASLTNSIVTRPEYVNDLLDHSTSDTLRSALHWVDSSIKRIIVDKLLDAKIQTLVPESLPEELEQNLSGLFTEALPLSYPVLGDKITMLPQQSVKSDDLQTIPSTFLQQWLPKFVYSRPDIKEKVKIYFPGGKSIGHSSILLKLSSGMILLDFGLSVVNATLPKWNPLLEKIDALFLSHAHLDHSGGIPLLLQNSRKLPWFAKKETRVLSEFLWNDTANILSRNLNKSMIKSSEIKHLVKYANISNALENFNEIKIGEPMKVLPKVEITAHPASHLFGSVGYEINIDGKRLLYTGDFNLDGSITHKGAKFPTDVDLTIFDGTYYGREVEYQPAQNQLNHALKHSNRIIIPAFSMGRSQEMLFQLKKLGAEKQWNIFLTGMGGKLAKKLALTVGQSGAGRKAGVNIVRTVDPDDFGDKSIVITGQGMLQAGTSRRLFEATKDDDNTSVILCGYQAPNTLGYHLLNEHPYLNNKFQQQIYRVKMSGHSSASSLDQFLAQSSGKKIIVHSPPDAQKQAKKDEITIPELKYEFI